jgi:hypothetical protein
MSGHLNKFKTDGSALSVAAEAGLKKLEKYGGPLRKNECNIVATGEASSSINNQLLKFNSSLSSNFPNAVV